MSDCECGRTWTGLSEAHCATCHESFSTVANFDAHRFFRSGKDGDWNSRNCRTAAEIDQLCSKSGRKLFQRAERKGGYVWVGAGLLAPGVRVHSHIPQGEMMNRGRND